MALKVWKLAIAARFLLIRHNFDFSFIFLGSSANITVLMQQIPVGIMLVIVLPKI